MKMIPAPIDEKNISSDWLYEGLGDRNHYSVVDNDGSFYRSAFYRRFNLWEARWSVGFNMVSFENVAGKASREDLDEFFNYVKAQTEDTGDESLVVEYDKTLLYSERIFTMSFYFKIDE